MKVISILALLIISCTTGSLNRQENIKPEVEDTSKYLIIGNYHLDRTKLKIDLGSDGHEYAHTIDSYMDAYVCFHYVECRKCKK